MKNLKNGFWNKQKQIYLILFIVLLLLEVFIALFVKDKFIRPYFGDVIVVVLLYFLIRIFVTKSNKNIIWGIFCFAVFVEFLQYIKLVEILHLENNKIISTIIGTTFDIKDIICYAVGTLFIVLLEKYLDKRICEAN